MKSLYTLTASPFSAHFPALYQELDIAAERYDSARNLHRALKQQVPDFFVGEFIYAWGNDYAGNTISNLDVTLRTLEAVAPRAKIIIVMQPSEEAHIGKLLELFRVHAVLKHPIVEDQMRAALQSPVH
ncbi:MAG: hypothetical protein FD187_3035 [bacterium]|nr:MAG: hypothetical protein FD142_3017 [bacterium]KAF0147134.1 MAG: hypothetical protein FD187_3035 [bacterium]KAF0165109.1 MAG: hypothetical protein FD158_2960 [bacterium]TXT22831.1 MAG: hypothetical protein FD132_209 [bacterium]